MASRGVLIVAQHPREPFLPTPSTLYLCLPHAPSAVTRLHISPRRFSLHPLHSLAPARPPPELPFSTDLRASATIPSTALDETPSDIHPRVSSGLIIKCITLDGPRESLPLFPASVAFAMERHGSPRIFGSVAIREFQRQSERKIASVTCRSPSHDFTWNSR